MIGRIDCIDYFDYTHKIGRFESLRDFASISMTYFGVAISTSAEHINATPKEFRIDADKTNMLREHAITYVSELVEIGEMLAKNSPQYLLIHYYDGTKKYYRHHTDFCKVFDMAWKCEHKAAVAQKTQQHYEKEIDRVGVEALKAVMTQSQKKSPINTYFPIEPYYQSTPSTSKTSTKSNNSRPIGKMIIWTLVTIGLLALMLGAVIDLDDLKLENKQAQTEPTLAPVAEPISGTILSGKEIYGESELTIIASSSESYLIKLKTQSGITRLSFYVRAGDTVTVGVPDEELYVYFASGNVWYGMDHLFGENTSYSMDDEVKDFWQYTYEYTLYPVTNGNFSETPIDPEDF